MDHLASSVTMADKQFDDFIDMRRLTTASQGVHLNPFAFYFNRLKVAKNLLQTQIEHILLTL